MNENATTIQVRVLHNTTRDGLGRLVGYVDGYQPDHTLEEVYTYPAPVDSDPMKVAEVAFFLFNVGDDPDFTNGEPHPTAIDYRTHQLRSVSVGDVIVVGTEALACGAYGWERIELPAEAVKSA
jgi:hypothetical protein